MLFLRQLGSSQSVYRFGLDSCGFERQNFLLGTAVIISTCAATCWYFLSFFWRYKFEMNVRLSLLYMKLTEADVIAFPSSFLQLQITHLLFISLWLVFCTDEGPVCEQRWRSLNWKLNGYFVPLKFEFFKVLFHCR